MSDVFMNYEWIIDEDDCTLTTINYNIWEGWYGNSIVNLDPKDGFDKDFITLVYKELTWEQFYEACRLCSTDKVVDNQLLQKVLVRLKEKNS